MSEQKSFTGIIVEESLEDTQIINNLEISKVEISNDLDWHMYTVKVTEQEIQELSGIIKAKWYMHFWSGNQVITVFKDKTFEFEHDKPETWQPAVEYGLALGIPKEQLDFPITH